MVPSSPIMNNDSLVDLVAENEDYLGSGARDRRVLDAMRRVDRIKFLPDIREIKAIVDARSLARMMRFLTPAVQEGNYLDSLKLSPEAILRILQECYIMGLSAKRAEYPVREQAYIDKPVMIGPQQTCSQPSMVALMVDVLRLEPGMKVLEVGTGCGYHAAVVLEMLGEEGNLVTIERDQDTADMGAQNLASYFMGTRLMTIRGDGSFGLPSQAPYDRVYFTAGVNQNFDPAPLAQQLTRDGILLFPETQGRLIKETYDGYGELKDRETWSGVCFGPLEGRNS